MAIAKHAGRQWHRHRWPVVPAPSARRPERELRLGSNLVARMLRTGCLQSFVAHAIALIMLALIVHSAKESSAPVRLELAATEEAEDPINHEVMFVIDLEAPGVVEAEAEPVPIEDAPVGLLNLDDVLIEAEPSAAASAAWAEVSGTELSAELVPEPQGPRLEPQEVRGLAGPVQPASAAPASPGMIGGELGRRQQAAGAQTGDVQVSMRWDGVNDIDLHVMVEPFGGGRRSLISWQQKFGSCGGVLDVDANAHPAQLTPTPVENVFWARGRAPFGRYTIAVHHYMPWSRLPRTPVEVAVLVDGKVSTFQILANYGEPAQVVTSFIRHPAGAAGQLAAANPSN